MRALVRYLVLVPAAYVAACLVGSFVLALGLGGERPLIETALVIALYAGALLASPMLVAIFITEALRVRSVVVWLLVGGVVGVIVLIGDAVNASTSLTAGRATAFVASGLAGGLVYWLIAGRNAGIDDRSRDAKATGSKADS